MQPDSSAPQEPQVETPVVEKKPRNVFKILFFVLLAVFVLTAAGLGYWAYQLNTTLTATQTELADLQAQHKKLTAERDTLSSNLDKTTTELESTKTELESTKTELSTTQSNLSKAQSDLSAANNKITKAGKLVTVLAGLILYDNNDNEIERNVEASGDAELIDLWEEFDQNPTQANFNDWFEYLIEALETLLT